MSAVPFDPSVSLLAELHRRGGELHYVSENESEDFAVEVDFYGTAPQPPQHPFRTRRKSPSPPPPSCSPAPSSHLYEYNNISKDCGGVKSSNRINSCESGRMSNVPDHEVSDNFGSHYWRNDATRNPEAGESDSGVRNFILKDELDLQTSLSRSRASSVALDGATDSETSPHGECPSDPVSHGSDRRIGEDSDRTLLEYVSGKSDGAVVSKSVRMISHSIKRTDAPRKVGAEMELSTAGDTTSDNQARDIFHRSEMYGRKKLVEFDMPPSALTGTKSLMAIPSLHQRKGQAEVKSNKVTLCVPKFTTTREVRKKKKSWEDEEDVPFDEPPEEVDDAPDDEISGLGFVVEYGEQTCLLPSSSSPPFSVSSPPTIPPASLQLSPDLFEGSASNQIHDASPAKSPSRSPVFPPLSVPPSPVASTVVSSLAASSVVGPPPPPPYPPPKVASRVCLRNIGQQKLKEIVVENKEDNVEKDGESDEESIRKSALEAAVRLKRVAEVISAPAGASRDTESGSLPFSSAAENGEDGKETQLVAPGVSYAAKVKVTKGQLKEDAILAPFHDDKRSDETYPVITEGEKHQVLLQQHHLQQAEASAAVGIRYLRPAQSVDNARNQWCSVRYSSAQGESPDKHLGLRPFDEMTDPTPSANRRVTLSKELLIACLKGGKAETDQVRREQLAVSMSEDEGGGGVEILFEDENPVNKGATSVNSDYLDEAKAEILDVEDEQENKHYHTQANEEGRVTQGDEHSIASGVSLESSKLKLLPQTGNDAIGLLRNEGHCLTEMLDISDDESVCSPCERVSKEKDCSGDTTVVENLRSLVQLEEDQDITAILDVNDDDFHNACDKTTISQKSFHVDVMDWLTGDETPPTNEDGWKRLEQRFSKTSCQLGAHGAIGTGREVGEDPRKKLIKDRNLWSSPSRKTKGQPASSDVEEKFQLHQENLLNQQNKLMGRTTVDAGKSGSGDESVNASDQGRNVVRNSPDPPASLELSTGIDLSFAVSDLDDHITRKEDKETVKTLTAPDVPRAGRMPQDQEDQAFCQNVEVTTGNQSTTTIATLGQLENFLHSDHSNIKSGSVHVVLDDRDQETSDGKEAVLSSSKPLLSGQLELDSENDEWESNISGSIHSSHHGKGHFTAATDGQTDGKEAGSESLWSFGRMLCAVDMTSRVDTTDVMINNTQARIAREVKNKTEGVDVGAPSTGRFDARFIGCGQFRHR